MRYQHRDGEAAPGAVSLTPVRDDAAVDDSGVFAVDEDREDFDAVHEALVDAGHEPLDDSADGDGGDSDAGESADGSDAPQASDFTETELVEMDRPELRPIAAQYDDIDGNASGDKLTEELIKKLREETADDQEGE